MVSAPQSEITPPSTHTSATAPTLPASAAMMLGTRKIPLPMVSPTAAAAALQTPSWRGSASGRAGGAPGTGRTGAGAGWVIAWVRDGRRPALYSADPPAVRGARPAAGALRRPPAELLLDAARQRRAHVAGVLRGDGLHEHDPALLVGHRVVGR